MNLNPNPLSLTGSLFASALVMTVSANAQMEDVGAMVNEGLTAMNAGQWEQSLAIHTQIAERFGKNNPLMLHGPQFGVVYYRKGISEMKLNKWAEAIASFEICYRDFPNAPTAKNRNNFNKLALLKWGEAAMGAKNWELALSQFKKFIEEREPRDRYPQGLFHVNMAICEYNVGRIAEGNENLEIAIKNKESFLTPDAGIVAGFQALVTAVIEKRNEQALLDFINKNRGQITIEPFQMHRYSQVFLKLAGDAIGVDMQRAALELYQLVPSTDVAIDDLRARLDSLATAKGVKDGSNNLARESLEKELKSLEDERRGKAAPEMIKLAAIAFIHEKNGNVRGANAAYDQLERFYPTASKREDNLYNLTRTFSLLGDNPNTQKNAEKFLKSYGDSKHVPAVRRMQLSSLFFNGQYQACIEVALPMLKLLEGAAPTPEHDMCLHVLGGSYFYTGAYDKAKEKLDEHVEKYPDSIFAIPALYFQASNESRLQFWAKSGRLLDEFMAKYPDPKENIFLPFALFDRATCHYAEDQNEGALENIARVIKEFPQSKVVDQAYNLRGNIQQADGDLEAAEASYVKALEIAEQTNNSSVAGESIYYLTSMLGEAGTEAKPNPRAKDAIAYADKFWKDYADGSPYTTQVAVAQMASMDAVGRTDEALERLQKVISEMAKNPEATGLEGAINSYTEAYLKNKSPEELKDHYYNFPGIRSTDSAARALLRIAIIGVFEDVAKKAQEPAQKNQAEIMIRVLFQELKTDFALKDLTNFILVKLGDYLRTNTSAPREALPYYDETLGRQDQAYRFDALLGRADVYGRSNTPADLEKGIEDFRRVYADAPEKSQKEFSLYRIIELLMAQEKYDEAAKEALLYLDREKTGYSKYSPEVGLMLANTYRDRKKVDDAISMYVKVWSAQMGYVKVSAKAMKSWMELSWTRNKGSSTANTPSDRQGAYEGGARYLELTSRFKDKMTEEEVSLWNEVEALVKTYEADPNITSVSAKTAQ